MIDIVTVVFEPELAQLKLQAQSINLYCHNISIRNIYVVVNDLESLVQKIDPLWWGAFAPRVSIVPRSLFSTEFASNGWVSQQVLKILTASISHNVWSMVLDAKTVFVRNLEPKELIDSQGRICVGNMPLYPVFEPAKKIVNRTFNIDLERQVGPGGVPFFFHNDTVRLMIAETAFVVKKNFASWFQEQGQLTEFVLYSGYLQYRFKGFDSFYSNQNSIYPCNVCHSEVERFDSKLEEMKQTQTNTVSIHREAWNKLLPIQQQQYRDYLIGQGISQAANL